MKESHDTKFLKEVQETKFDGDRYLEIDPGRYLAIDDDGRYVISGEPQAIRGTPFGGHEGMRVAFGGGRLGDYRTFAIDCGDTIDIVSIGIVFRDDGLIWIVGDKIRREDEDEDEQAEDDDDVKEEYFPILISKHPKQSPHNMSAKQVLDGVEKQTFATLRADMKRAGLEPPDDGYFYRDMSWLRKKVKEGPYTMEYYCPYITRPCKRKRRKRMRIRKRNIFLFGKRHIYPLMKRPKPTNKNNAKLNEEEKSYLMF